MILFKYFYALCSDLTVRHISDNISQVQEFVLPAYIPRLSSMRKIIASIIVLLSCSALQAQNLPEDTHIWTSTQFVVGLKKGKDKKGKEIDKVALLVDLINRFGDNVSRPVDQRVAASIEYRFSNFFRLTSGYLYQKAAPLRIGKNYESRFVIAGTFDRKAGDVNLRSRIMAERKFRNSRADTTNYRFLLQAGIPIKYNKKELFAPYIANEPYYDTLSNTWSRNEFKVGLTRKLTTRLTGDIYYIRVDTRPFNINGLGLHLRVKIR